MFIIIYLICKNVNKKLIKQIFQYFFSLKTDPTQCFTG